MSSGFKLRRAQKIGRKFQAPVPTEVGGLSTVWKVLPELIFGRKERTPRVPPGPFRTDPAVYRSEPVGGMRITWFGHSSMLLEIDGVGLLIDPVWDERAGPVTWAGPKRFFAPTLRLEELPEIDAILLSHDHYDHLGKSTVRALAKLMPGARWIVPLEVGAIVRGFGVAADRVTELDWTEDAVVTGKQGAPLTVTAVPARHFSGRSLGNRNETLWSSYVLQGATHRVWFGADTGWWEGIHTIREQLGPFDLTMLEIGAFNEAWKDIHLGPDGAVRAFEALGGGLLMPIHWGLFDLALHAWREPIERVRQLAAERGFPLFSPEPGLPTAVSANLMSNWWR